MRWKSYVLHKGMVTLIPACCDEDIRTYLLANPHADVYFTNWLLEGRFYHYRLDRVKRHPRLARMTIIKHSKAPAAIKTALLLNPI